MPAHPIQIHIVISHESGRTAERSYMRDEDGWALLTTMRHANGETEHEDEQELESSSDALMNALMSMRTAFGMMLSPSDSPLPELIPVDTRPHDSDVMN